MTMRARASMLGIWLLAGCAKGNAYQAPPQPPHPIADAEPTELPPHRFYARQPTGNAYPVFQRVGFSSLPAMVQSKKCFDAGAVAEGRPAALGGQEKAKTVKKTKKTKGTPAGHVPYVADPSATPTTPTATKSPAKPGAAQAPAAEPAGELDDSNRIENESDGGEVATGQAAPTENAPTDVSVVESESTSKQAKRDARKARREAKRANDEALATSGGGPPAMSASEAAIAIDPEPRLVWPPVEEGWGAATYLSNDDSMSLSSAQRVIFAIDGFLPLPAEHIRPHELLNYFSFDTAPVGAGDDFSVEASIAPDPEEAGIYSLAMAVRGHPLALEERRNANLSLVIDRSGSMSAEGRMTYLRRGLEQMTSQLKTGDMVHLVLFDHEVCTAVENFVVGRDQPTVLMEAVRRLEPRGSTDLHLGLTEGYALADRTYRPTYTNRVVMITDAIANTGITDEQLIATVGKYYDERRIRLSGVGVGREFNDSLLDRLTERGKGAYVFLGSEAEVDAVFGPRFISLVETTALDVHFQLHLPPSLRMNVFYGEESSTVKEDVQAIHYFANTSQLFLSDLMARGGQDGAELREQDQVMLTIEYEDPESGDDRVEEYAFTLGEIAEADRNVRKGRLVMHFVDGLAWMASRPVPSAWGSRGHSWEDAEAWQACEDGRTELAVLAQGLEDDPEARRVKELWDRYCARYSQPREPVRRPPPVEGWPSASGR